ncbi:MAG: alpha/beta fold hydrolase [Gemmatimonadota bacterium]
MIWALHGAFGDAKDWDALAASLGPDRLVAVDLWADEHEAPLRAWADAFNRHVAAVDSAPVLLGYSMGARLGLHALIADPHLWKGAILVAPHPGLLDERARLSRREQDRQWITRFDELPWSDFWREWTRQPVLATPDPRPLPPERRARRRCLELWSLSEQDDLRPELGRIECPVQWVTGENDPKFTAIASGMTPLVPGSEQLTISGAGHRVPWDTPELFADLVDGFVTGLQVG